MRNLTCSVWCRRSSILVTILVLVIILVMKLGHNTSNAEANWKEPQMSNSNRIFDEVSPPFSAVLIDLQVLRGHAKKLYTQGEEKIKVAVEVTQQNYIKETYHYKYDILYYEIPKNKDYILFHGTDERAIPRIEFYNYRNLSIPRNVNYFMEVWRRSRLISCIGLDMQRSSKSYYLPRNKTIKSLSYLVAEMVSQNIYPFIVSGTLLGWFRECDIIPHTMDVDIAAPIEQYNPSVLKPFKRNGAKLRHVRTLGRVNDSLVYTFRPPDGGAPWMDFFWMYNSENESWIAGTAADGTKYRFIYPRLTFASICSAILLDHLFWVPCDPVKALTSEYGPKWFKDHLTDEFIWHASPNNIRKIGQYRKEEMEEVYKTY